jgi:hypothetical protein
MNLSVNEGVIS